MASFVVAAFSVANVTLVDVFNAGESGYACFRLPALLNLPGDAHAFALYAEARNKSCADGAPTDVVYKVSRDSGATWGPLGLACTDGCSRHDAAYVNSTSQPSPVAVPPKDGHLGYVVLLANRGGDVVTMRSLDTYGEKWAPLNYSRLGSGHHPVTVGPTPGIQLPSGRLVVAAHQSAYAEALLSDDGGLSWRRTGPAANGTIPSGGEGEIALAPNGSLVINLRHSNPYKRLLSWSDDDGETWSAPAIYPMPELGGSCEGSMITIGDAMLTASPWGVGPDWGHRCAGPGRCNMTVWTSWDSGATWDVTHQLNESVNINSREAAAYSTLARVNSTHFALVYERGGGARYLSLAHLPLPTKP